MPQKVIRFKGINRKINEYHTSGECEELINLRPDINGGLSVVRSKSIWRASVNYDKMYEHAFGDTYNQITVSGGTVEWINTKNGIPQVLTDDFAGQEVEISSAGNVLVIYSEEDNSQLVFKFEDGKYKEYLVSIKQITGVSISYSSLALLGADAEDNSAAALTEAMHKAASSFHENYTNGLCGASVIGCTYELDDGTEIWSTAFAVADITTVNNYEKPFQSTTDGGEQMIVSGAKNVSLHLDFADMPSSGIKRLNVYSTRPILPFDVSKESGGPTNVSKLSLEEIRLDGELMYYQGSIDISQKNGSLPLRFNKELLGEKVMEVDAGCIERRGPSVSYNNRFHYYRSEVRHVIQVPTVSDMADLRTSSSYWIAYVNFDGKWKLINKIYRFNESIPNSFIYPMAGIKQLAFVKGDYPQGGEYSALYNEMFYVDLKDSSAYNYSYAFDVIPELVPTDGFYETVEADGQLWGDKLASSFDTKVTLRKEANAINVSAPYNPFAFPVKYSYSFSGEILDVTTAYQLISVTQVGQYPLNVFTSNGIFALEQGGGDVLYSNITPLQPHVIDGKATTTPYGTFFVSSKNLYILSGREVADISYVLGFEPDNRLRELDSYKKLCCTPNGPVIDCSMFLSERRFEFFINKAKLAYDQLQNELYISSDDYPYSYVFNLDTKQYHKVTKKLLNVQNGARYAIQEVLGSRSIVDLHNEGSGNSVVFLQSRPMSLEALYTHIQRMILLVDADLDYKEKRQHLCLSVFASDNLHDWKCIISSQKHDVALRQIRTNKSAKSYKDYIIVISGFVSTETDISDLIADYSVVNRRLG